MRSNPQKGHVWSIWLENEELCQAVNFATVSREGPTRKGPTKVSIWQKIVFALPSLYPHYIYHHYLRIVRSAFSKENPSKYTWELEIVIPTIIYTFPCGGGGGGGLKNEELCQAVNFTTVLREGPTREGPAKVFVWKKYCIALPSLYPHYIYPYYSQIVRSAF